MAAQYTRVGYRLGGMLPGKWTGVEGHAYFTYIKPHMGLERKACIRQAKAA